MTMLTPCRFLFSCDDATVFDGFAYGTKWNGCDNVAITPAVRDQIGEWFLKTQPYDPQEHEDMFAMEPGPDGLISLAGGYATSIVEG